MRVAFGKLATSLSAYTVIPYVGLVAVAKAGRSRLQELVVVALGLGLVLCAGLRPVSGTEDADPDDYLIGMEGGIGR